MINRINILKLVFLKICILYLTFHSFYVISQEVSILTTKGDRINGLLLEGELSIKIESGVIKIPASDLVLIEFISNSKQVLGGASLHLVKGRQLLESGLESDAIEEFKAAINEAPEYADAYYELGKVMERQGNTAEALEYFGRVIALDPQKPGMRKYFKDAADAYYRKDENSKAADIYYRLFINFPEDEAAEYAIYRAGFLFSREPKDSQKALWALESAVAVFPESENAEKGLYELGQLYKETGKPEAAKSALIQLVSDFSGEWCDNAHLMLARIYRQDRQDDKATEEIMKVINESSDKSLISAAQQMLNESVWTIYSVSDKLPGDDVRALALDKDFVWIGTSTGITRFDLKTDLLTGEIFLPDASVKALAADDVYLWAVTSNMGIQQYDKAKKTWSTLLPVKRYPIPAAISVDSDYIWIGTESSGIYQYNKHDGSWKTYTLKDGLTDSSIISISSTPYGIWYGTLKNGAGVFDSSTGRWKAINDQATLGDKSIPFIAGEANYMWFAWYEDFRNGVSRYDTKTKSWDEWAITEWEASTEPSPDNNINSSVICIGANNRGTWIGTDSVAIFYDYSSSKWSNPFNYPPNLTGHTPACILVEDGTVWLATPAGLGRLNKDIIDKITMSNQ